MPVDKKAIGARLRAEREAPPRRSREKWAIVLRNAAGPEADRLPDVKTLAHMIKEWERGDHIPGPIYRPLYARVTGKSEEELFDVVAPPSRRSAVSSGAIGQMIKMGSQETEPHVMDGLRAHCQADLVSSGRESQTVDTSEAFLDTIEHLIFTQASGDLPVSGRHRVDITHVSQIEAATKVFRAWDNRFGGGLRRKAVVGQLTELTNLLAGPFPNQQVGKRLYLAVADLAQLAGFMSFDLRLHATAREYFVFGLRLAIEAGDRLQAARMLYCLARQMIELDRPRAALDLTQTGLYAIRRRAAPRVAAMLHGMEGRAYGCMGDAAGCRRSLGIASEKFASTGADPEWTEFFSQTELAGIRGVALRDLALRHLAMGDEARVRVYAAEARPWIEQAAESRPAEYLRSQILDLDGLAITELLSGKPEPAMTALSRALDATAEVNSGRVGRNLRRTIRLGKSRYPHVPEVREVADRAHAILPGTAERM